MLRFNSLTGQDFCCIKFKMFLAKRRPILPAKLGFIHKKQALQAYDLLQCHCIGLHQIEQVYLKHLHMTGLSNNCTSCTVGTMAL